MWKIFWLFIFYIIETTYGFCQNDGCTFNGQSYELYSEVEFGCFVFQCVEYSWQFRYINGSCPQCGISNDPHFMTFDHHYYDFHGLCNYTISQPVGCCDAFSSYLPPYGIFGDFQICGSKWPGPSCLDLTTYKISDDLSIQIKHTYPTPLLEINGSPLTPISIPISYYGCSSSSLSSVIIWSSESCIYIVGTHYTIHACSGHMVIYTVVESMYNIAGLCGFYSGTTDDEYQLRNCGYESFGNEIPFGEDWKTIDQRGKECRGCSSLLIPQVEICVTEEAFKVCESVISQAFEKCPSGYTKIDYSIVIENCAEDCCSTGMEYCEKWANVALEYLCSLNELENLTNREVKGRK